MLSLLSSAPSTRGEAPPRHLGLLRAATFVHRPHVFRTSSARPPIVRPLVHGDWPAIEHMKRISASKVSVSAEGTKHSTDQLYRCDVHVAEDPADHRIAGYVATQMRRFTLAVDPSAPQLDHASPERDGELHIVDLGVDPEFQGREIESILLATVLFDFAVQHPKCRSALLFVRRADVALRQVAAARRFLVVDCLTGAQGSAESMLAMRRYF